MELEHCAVCGADGANVFSGCRSLSYCSKEHQKVDWKKHKPNCKPYRIVCDEGNIGEHLVVSRDLKPGEIILKEEALLVTPKLADGPALCLGCCKDLNGLGVECPNCKWPMCGRQERYGVGSHHALGECSLLKKAGSRVTGNFAQEGIKEIYQTIMVLRCLSLRERDPTKFEKPMQLKYDKYCFRLKTLESVVSATVVKLIREWMSDAAAVSSELIVTICCIVEENDFELPHSFDERPDGLRTIYSLATYLIGHSCIANARSSIAISGEIIVRAAVAISKGTRICFSRVNTSLLTAKRQLKLAKTMALYQRNLLQDVSNLKGILLPENPLNKETDWVCNNCSERNSNAAITMFLAEIDHGVKSLNRQSIPECLSFIQKYSEIMHPNHFFLLQVKWLLCAHCPSYEESLFNQGNGSSLIHIPDPNLIKIQDFAKDVLKVIDVLSPGSHHLRGQVLYFFYFVVDINTIRAPDDTEPVMSYSLAIKWLTDF